MVIIIILCCPVQNMLCLLSKSEREMNLLVIAVHLENNKKHQERIAATAGTSEYQLIRTTAEPLTLSG